MSGEKSLRSGMDFFRRVCYNSRMKGVVGGDIASGDPEWQRYIREFCDIGGRWCFACTRRAGQSASVVFNRRS